MKDLWCIGGEFNVVRFPIERNKGRKDHRSHETFSHVVDDIKLKDFLAQGETFTWMGGLNNRRKRD